MMMLEEMKVMEEKIEEKFYNYEIKKEYLESLNNEILENVVGYLLRNTAKTEKTEGKDLYDMTLEEIESVLYSLKPSSEKAAYSNTLKISDYIDWAFDQGYRKSNITPLSLVDKTEWSKKFVAHYTRMFFTREEILDMCDALHNYVDKAVLLATFEGIGGKGYKELLNLRVKDIEEDVDQIFLTVYESENESRKIEISSKLANFLRAADTEDTYVSGNGEAIVSKASYSKYEDSEYVFKKSRRGKQSTELNNFYVLRKFTFFKDFFGMTYLRAKDIRASGMMYLANELAEETETLTREDLHKIGKHYKTPMTNSPTGKHYRNLYVIREVLDVPEFEEMYGYKLKYQ
ncbi:phage lytic cycle repressor MrpR family protein [Sporosarcina sp. FSL W7-1283]|uniref:phage lytic cycle repressor MrpR family protein n=1 Tax=Sporosarcina sp. FSL W7-1283 TaxID=2921560 RepID=UPI0030F7D724